MKKVFLFFVLICAQFKGELCCAYGTDGKQIDNAGAYDCLMIPGARKASDSALKPVSQCGLKVGLVTASGTTAATVCCNTMTKPSLRNL